MSNSAQTQVVVTLPTTRVDGSALAATEIATMTLSKANGAAAAAVVDTVEAPFSSPSVTFVDPSPDFGSTDNYSATVTDVEGNVSAVGLAAPVAVPPSVLAAPSPPTVAATFQPAVA
jgi:hypothetical protein